MLNSASPVKIPLIWASAAIAPYINVIPTPSQQGIKNGAASWTDGFPPLCFVPYAGGGAGPWGADFNGLLKQISAGVQWLQAGASQPFDPVFSAAVGGYPKGALVANETTLGMWWQSTIDNNTVDPDVSGPGTSWNSLSSGGNLINVQKFSGAGTYTYTPTAGTNSIVVEAVGGGGAGAGCAVSNVSPNLYAIGTNGTSGAYGRGRYVTGFAGVSVIIGAGGANALGGAGGNGGVTSFGALLSCPGGIGGSVTEGGPTAAPISGGQGNLTGLPTGANIFGANGNLGQQGFVSTASFGWGASGGESPYSDGGRGISVNQNGATGRLGSGGSGTSSYNNGSAISGGNGGDGLVIVWEFG